MLKILFIAFSFFLTPAMSLANEVASQDGQYIYKGLIEIGGSGALSLYNDNSAFYLSPYGGYFLTDKLLVGGNLDYSTGSGRRDSYGVSANVKYYVHSDGPLAIFIGQRLGISWSGSNSNGSGATSLGTQYFLNQKVSAGLTFNFSYSLDRFDTDSSMGSVLGSLSTYY